MQILPLLPSCPSVPGLLLTVIVLPASPPLILTAPGGEEGSEGPGDPGACRTKVLPGVAASMLRLPCPGLPKEPGHRGPPAVCLQACLSLDPPQRLEPACQ